MVSIPMANERLIKELLSLFMPTGLKSFMMGNIKKDYCKHVLISRGISNEVFQT